MRYLTRYIMLMALVVITMPYAFAEWEIQPQYPDLVPNDGFFDAGTQYNPYVLRDSYGRTKATIEPKFPDLNPNDGFFDAGTQSNPYVLDWE